ncbi:hypothetical protein FSHL1_001916 [Fusarium sambucinum]
MPHLGPMDAFEDHIEVASTQRNATQRNTTGARDWETFSRVIHGFSNQSISRATWYRGHVRLRGGILMLMLMFVQMSYSPSWCSKDVGRSAMELGVSASSIEKKAIAHVDQPSIDLLI